MRTVTVEVPEGTHGKNREKKKVMQPTSKSYGGVKFEFGG